MDILETPSTLGTQDNDQQQTKQKTQNRKQKQQKEETKLVYVTCY